ncbi:MAG: CPBP family intramembrane glutamic endopeptidase [Prevotella sp.]|jgi:membrane protease YdiL (CAAX protease family)
MEKISIKKGILDIILYLIMFVLIQFIAQFIVGFFVLLFQDHGAAEALKAVASGNLPMDGLSQSIIAVVSSLLTMFLFIRCHWVSVSRSWIATRPWTAIAWVILLALGTILPSQWVEERMNIVMPEAFEHLFEQVMSEPVGYLAIGILAPLAEELVFRGAILGRLLQLFSQRLHWVAILLSALIFGAVHGNLPQFVHATFIGLILGWMYYRTNSVAPGVVFHWINNTVAYVMFNLMPQMADGKLIDLFHGDHKTMIMGIIFSLCIFIPSLFQLSQRLRRSILDQ